MQQRWIHQQSITYTTYIYTCGVNVQKASQNNMEVMLTLLLHLLYIVSILAY
jgi:predicted ABC-type sugar transport system permease subunit